MTAYHEAGHALVAAKTKGADQVTKITIVPRAMSLGHTQYEPSDDYTNFTQSKVSGMIRAALGGRAAEEVVFDEFTVGASNDIERATTLAHRMVTDFGMSSLGPINYVNSNLSMFEPNPESKAIGYSEEIAKKIDVEVSKIINNEYEEARKILLENRSLLDRISEELLQKETLEQDDFDKIMSEIRSNKDLFSNKIFRASSYSLLIIFETSTSIFFAISSLYPIAFDSGLGSNIDKFEFT
jgi:cell division protease FtsH